MKYYTGQGEPLDDDRLSKSGTNISGKQQYKIWSDSQQILVPKGQSTTKINASENVQCNTSVFGAINEGYFETPTIEFRNTTDFRLFDRLKMSTYRENLTDPDLEIFKFNSVTLSFDLIIDWHNKNWLVKKRIVLLKDRHNSYKTSNNYNINTYDYYNEIANFGYELELECYFSLGLLGTHELGDINSKGMSLYLMLEKCNILNGSSSYIYNTYFNPNIPIIEIKAENIKIERGDN